VSIIQGPRGLESTEVVSWPKFFECLSHTRGDGSPLRGYLKFDWLGRSLVPAPLHRSDKRETLRVYVESALIDVDGSGGCFGGLIMSPSWVRCRVGVHVGEIISLASQSVRNDRWLSSQDSLRCR
jgi:hypothetical protein